MSIISSISLILQFQFSARASSPRLVKFSLVKFSLL